MFAIKQFGLPVLFFFFPLAFDFRGVEEGGGALQAFLLVLTLCGGISLLFSTGQRNLSQRPAGRVWAWLLAAVLVLSLLQNLFNDVAFSRYIRVVLPFALFYIAFVTAGTVAHRCSFDGIYKLMLSVSLISTVFTLVYGFLSTGLSVLDIRYQIIGPAILLLAVCCFYAIFFRKPGFFEVFGLVLVVAIALVSVTRNTILGVAGVFLFIASMHSCRGRLIGAVRGFVFYLFVASLASVLVLFALYLLNDDIYLRLMGRFFGSSEQFGFDVTTYTRLAEIDNQLDQWRESVWTILFGKGLGAAYTFHERYFGYILQIMDMENTDVDWWFAGHNFWVYSLFSQGLMAGVLVPFVVVVGLLRSVWLSVVVNTSERGPAVFYAACSVSFIFVTVGGNPFGSRFSGVLYGLLFGLIFVVNNKKSPLLGGGCA